jgi:hypothetical protein
VIVTKGFPLIRLFFYLPYGTARSEASPLPNWPQHQSTGSDFSYDLIDSVGISIVTARPVPGADCT